MPKNACCISSQQLPVKILPQTYTVEMANAETLKWHREGTEVVPTPSTAQTTQVRTTGTQQVTAEPKGVSS